MVPARIPHKTQCGHPQTPYARRKCRKAQIALAAQLAARAAVERAYQPGDEVDIDGTTVTLSRRHGRTGVRWSWWAPELDVAGEAYWPTPAEAIAHARRALASRCWCGQLATVTGSTRRTCTTHLQAA